MCNHDLFYYWTYSFAEYNSNINHFEEIGEYDAD